MTEYGKTFSQLRYNNVYNSAVDLRYSVLHGKVEEDIILKSKNATSAYMLTINTGGLTAVKQSDNSVVFNTAEGETIFTIAAPWMQDSASAVSDDIDVQVIQKGNTAYIGYKPDEDWLASDSRVYPVLIDPSVTTRTYTSNYVDTDVSTGDSPSTTRPLQPFMNVGLIGGGTIDAYAYIKILNFPENIPKENIMQIFFEFSTDVYSPTQLDLYTVNGAWDPNTITFANQPTSTYYSSLSNSTNGSYVTYSFDMRSWLDSISNRSISSYFKSSNWHGFKIGSLNDVILIRSSEHYDPSTRPTLLIRYTLPDIDYIKNGGVYRFNNYASGKMLTASNSNGWANGNNVYQDNNNNTVTQEFKLVETSISSGIYRIESASSATNNGNKVITVPYDETATENGYVDVNAYISEYSSSLADSQEWIIVPAEYGGYSILLRADPNLCLKPRGDIQGSATSDSPYDIGNVYLGEYESSDSFNAWNIESARRTLSGSYNIYKQYGETLEIEENTNWMKFYYIASDFGVTMSWISSNPSVATISSTGQVTTHKAGNVQIQAQIFIPNSNSTFESVDLVVIFKNGKYFFQNGQYDQVLQIDDDVSATQNGATMEIMDYDSGVDQRWNVTYLGQGYYKIKSVASDRVLQAPTALNDNVVQAYDIGSDSQKWRIVSSTSEKFKIYSVSSPSYSLAADNFSTSGDRKVKLKIDQSDYTDDWNVVFMRYGTKAYIVDNRTTVNCHGYAMGTNNWPTPTKFDSGEWTYGWNTSSYMAFYNLIDTEYTGRLSDELIKDLSDLLSDDFEAWLNANSFIAYKESSFSGNGEGAILAENQYRVVMRLGAYVWGGGALYETFRDYDYHFWYQTYDGRWANKHGMMPSELLEYGTTPYTVGSSGWENDSPDFYYSPIYSYVITVE